MSQNTLLYQIKQPIDNWSKGDWYRTIALLVVILGALATLSYLVFALILDDRSSESFYLSPVGDKSVHEGSLLEFTVATSNPDESTLSFSASNLPDGANFDTQTQTFSWVPTYAQAGNYTDIHFEISNGEEVYTEDIAIVVTQPNDPTDVNQDGDIDVLDVASIRERCGEIGSVGWIPEDVNHDGIINVLDMIPIGQYSIEG